jgi:lipoprotein-anchoring transpeptidase ErfK/SrfK
MKNNLLCAVLCMVGSCAWSAPAMPAPDFVLQRQIETPFEVLHPNPHTPGQPWILVGLSSQTLTLFDMNGREQAHFTVSTSKLGAGERVDSYQTPRGWHRICEKIGDGAAPDTIIYRRAITPWRYTAELHQQYPDKDWVLARILWLCGMEPGKNQGDGVDSHDRAIYIHGAGAHVAFGTPTSRGCVRMQTRDVISLYQSVQVGTDVDIVESR